MGPAQCGTGTWQGRVGKGVSVGEHTVQYGKPVVGAQGWDPGFTHSSAMVQQERPMTPPHDPTLSLSFLAHLTGEVSEVVPVLSL